MKITKSTVTKVLIEGAKSLDPITVFLEDFEPRRGSITIRCWDKSWTAYWGGMGERPVAEFFASVSADYAANCLSTGIAPTVFNPDGAKDHVKAQIYKDRRTHNLTKDEARDLFEEIDNEDIGDDPWQHSRLMHKIYGDEWWCALPEKPNPDYEYLCRIVRAVQAALEPEAVEEVAA